MTLNIVPIGNLQIQEICPKRHKEKLQDQLNVDSIKMLFTIALLKKEICQYKQ